jgi:3-(3-hydroxy-phenyl)propionate hydroxylase
MPRTVPFGWAAVVRPDKTILHDGPASESTRLVNETLQLLGTPAQAQAPSAHVVLPSV